MFLYFLNAGDFPITLIWTMHGHAAGQCHNFIPILLYYICGLLFMTDHKVERECREWLKEYIRTVAVNNLDLTAIAISGFIKECSDFGISIWPYSHILDS